MNRRTGALRRCVFPASVLSCAAVVRGGSQGIVFDPEAGDRYNADILAEAIPELQTYDSQYGAPFRSRSVPSMKLVMTTGIDSIPGATPPLRPPALGHS